MSPIRKRFAGLRTGLLLLLALAPLACTGLGEPDRKPGETSGEDEAERPTRPRSEPRGPDKGPVARRPGDPGAPQPGTEPGPGPGPATQPAVTPGTAPRAAPGPPTPVVISNLERRSAPRGGADFRLDFGGRARTTPVGAIVGINDYPSARLGCYKAMGEVLRPQGALARIWSRYPFRPFSQAQIDAAKAATAAGYSVCFTVVGAPEYFTTNAEAGTDALGKRPRSTKDWVERVVSDAKTLEKEGVDLTHLEIWNEPDLESDWKEGPEDFADFFAEVGKLLKGRLPALRVGGPGMSHAYGRSLAWFPLMMAACKRRGWEPDFFSWHDYLGYPTDQEAFDIANEVRRIARQHGIGTQEMILSEWNMTLPRPRAMELDDHRGASYFVAMTTGLIQAGFDHGMFFFLQDANWETDEDYGGYSVGVFTINGGPKAVFNAMQMVRIAGQYPTFPVERVGATWNLSLLGTRSGNRGYVLAANAFGSIEERTRKHLHFSGVDITAFKGREREIREYLAGRVSYERFGDAAANRAAWEEAKEFHTEHRQEYSRRSRPVRVSLGSPPLRIERVWLIDAEHGNPIQDASFNRVFDEVRQGLHTRATNAALVELRRQGMSEAEIAEVEPALRSKDRGAWKGRDPRTREAVEAAYQGAYDELSLEDPTRLAAHPAGNPWPVPAAGRFWLEGDSLAFDLPPFSAILIECSW